MSGERETTWGLTSGGHPTTRLRRAVPVASGTPGRWGLRAIGVGYLLALVAAPVFMVFRNAFEQGFTAAWDAMTTPAAIHAIELTLMIAAIVVPANAILGIGCALLLTRGPQRVRVPLGAVLSLPFAVPPVVVGLSLVLLYGRGGWIDAPFQLLFSWPGMVLATIFVSLPFVAREVTPVLREIGSDAEEAAATLGASGVQTFLRVTLPAIGPAIGYGVVLTTARALGEYGAVTVVSGRISGQTQSLPIFVEDRFSQFDLVSTYSAAVVLAILALLTLALMLRLNRNSWPSTS